MRLVLLPRLLLITTYATISALICNSSTFNISLLQKQCYGLDLVPEAATVSACISAACSMGSQMWEFCAAGSTCDTYVGPSCWIGSVGLEHCKPSTQGWIGASQNDLPPPPPPPLQKFVLPSRATPPLSVMDLSDEINNSWTLRVDRLPARSIRVPMGGYSSDFQDPPFIDQSAVSSVIYQRQFTPPAARAESVYHLQFGAVNHGAVISINGVEMGVHLGPMMPFGIDVTAPIIAAIPGEQLNLTVEVFPYLKLVGIVPSSFMYSETWKNDSANGFQSRSCAGICRFIRLVELPSLRVSSVQTSANIGPPSATTLTVRVSIVNDSPTPISNISFTGGLSSWNGGEPWKYPGIPKQIVAGELLPFGGSATVIFSVPWDEVGPESWWWPNRPYSSAYLAQLHFLNLTLSTGATSSTRFGFVEHNSSTYFYTLNGARVNHLSDATPENGMSYYDAYAFTGSFFTTNPRDVWKNYMSLGITSNRIHQSTPTEDMLNAADEVGFLLKPESPVRGGCDYTNCGHSFNLSGFTQSVTELVHFCRSHPSVFSYSVENESPQSFISALIDAANTADPSVPLTTEGSGSVYIYNGTNVTAVNLLHYAIPDDSRNYIRAVGECAWCVEAGLESFSSLAVAGRLNDVVYYAGWDMLNYWSNFFPGFNASRHAWKQKGCEGRDRTDGVDGWGSPLILWVQRAFDSFLPMDMGSFKANPSFVNDWPLIVDTVREGNVINRSILVFNDALRGDLKPWDIQSSQRTLSWSAHWDTIESIPILQASQNITVKPGFNTMANVMFTAPSPGGGAKRKLFIVLRNAPTENTTTSLAVVGIEDRVYVLVTSAE